MTEVERAVKGCEVPPEGWYCTRTPGHDGPCAAHHDPVVGVKTMEDGSHLPIRRREADAIWAEVEAEDARRKAVMPNEQCAIRQLFDAQLRLKELGWKDPIYAPKDGSPLDIIELGSTGIHRGHYDGKWPDGHWWVFDGGDVYPSRPALARRSPPEALAAAPVDGGKATSGFADAPWDWPLGTRVRKTKGSSWTGRIVGFYSTTLTPEGYAVESENEPGSVQIYPRATLSAAPTYGEDSK